MQFGFLGIDYKNADLTIRDEISFTDQKKLGFFHKAEEIGVEQVMILSTCNRSEIYYFFDDEQQIKKIQNIYCDMFDKAEIEQYIRHCEEDKAVSYLFQVTAGLESMVLGEDQILGQVKDALDFSRTMGFSKKELNKVVRDAITCAKKVKTTFRISEKPVSVGYIGICELQKICDIKDKMVLVIGSGDTAVLALRYLQEYEAGKIYLCSRTLAHAGNVQKETICNDPQVCRIVDLPVYYELETNNGNRDYRIQIGGHYMNYNTVYVGMDVHKESFTLCSCKYEDEKASHYQRTPASYKNVLRYLAFLRTIYGEDTRFVCGYEAGCLGYSLYHQLENFNVECVILAPTTMLEQRSKRRIKTDKRDAEIIARSLAQHNYSPVHIPTETDNQTKEFIRMRDDHKAELKKIKQQILSFCLRQGYQYDGSGNWTAKHVKWLRSLKPAGLYKEILDEYLLTYTILTDKLNRLDQRIEELASKEEYKESVSKLTCFLGIKTHTALSVIVEVGDFQRFVSARKFAGYLGLVPGQHSSGDDRNGLGITKAGNTHVRRLLVESAQSYTRGKIGYKSRVLRSRQAGNSPQVINYADRANERLRRRYYKMVLKDGKKYNIAKTAIARELACFIWGMMTDNIY